MIAFQRDDWGGEVKGFLKNSHLWRFLKKLKIGLPHEVGQTENTRTKMGVPIVA